ncbi:Multi antimicrobial extrusion protein [Corchorus olitorius]|uniref:Protein DETOXIFICATION n=1 Tax=Corchorus olitorius TaxID=93759 RepID=A0A1R3HP50_9ROSI|nr:Multi antimicrobial extrusion protein [Corchorus olitorius]
METSLNVEIGDGCREGRSKGNYWWERVLDFGEAKTQVLFAVPMVLSNVFYFSLTMVSVMFAGHLGELELAASTLAHSWAGVTGFAFMTGLSGALETLCGQGFGAKLYRMLGIYLQASCIISFLFSVITSIIWLYTEPILVLLHQDPEISKTAALYLKYLIPGLFAYGFVQNILRFLQTQSIVTPLVLLSVIPLGIHFGIVYALVNKTSLGFKGAPLAASISLWISFLLLVMYVVFAKKFESTWQGLSFESFHYILRNLKLALPSAAMVCLEFWAFEILIILAGLMPNSKITTSAMAMCINTQSIAYMFICGLGAAVSTRVSNELGAGNPDRAKHAMAVTLKLSILVAFALVLTLAFGHDIWAGFFSNSPSIIKKFADMTPLLVVSIAIDAIQGVLSGVARGCGWQHLAVWANLATFYLIGMTIAVVLGFKFKLYVKGLWIGLICGLASQVGALVLIALNRKWTKIELSDERNEETPISGGLKTGEKYRWQPAKEKRIQMLYSSSAAILGRISVSSSWAWLKMAPKFKPHRLPPTADSSSPLESSTKRARTMSTHSSLKEAFGSYADYVNTLNEKRERVVKASRDITMNSKKVIFQVHRLGKNNREEVLEKAEKDLAAVRDQYISQLVKELQGTDFWKLRRAYSPGVQEYVEAATFFKFCQTGTLLHLDEINSSIVPLSDPSLEPLQINLLDYLLGLADLTGELMRLAIGRISDGEVEFAKRICQFVRDIYRELTLVVPLMDDSHDMKIKMDTMLQSVVKIENACFSVRVRGSEYIPLLGSSDRGSFLLGVPDVEL